MNTIEDQIIEILEKSGYKKSESGRYKRELVQKSGTYIINGIQQNTMDKVVYEFELLGYGEIEEEKIYGIRFFMNTLPFCDEWFSTIDDFKKLYQRAL